MGERINLSSFISMRDEKANIEANNAALEEIVFAYAVDSNEIGIYNNGEWTWIGNSSSTSGELLMQDGVAAPPVPLENEAQDDWLYEG